MRFHQYVFGLLLVLAATFVGAQQGQLAQKLVDGSPWRFVTRHENSIYQFRLTTEGKLQRSFSGVGGDWVDLVMAADDIYEYRTLNGHIITFFVDSQGKASAKHSKHPSSFLSIKGE